MIKNKWISFALYIILIPTVLMLGIVLFKDRQYNIISMVVAFLGCVPFFLRFEKGKTTSREMVVIAVMTAISVVGRLIFAPLPGFKPVTAIVIITAIAFGKEAGFMTGSLSAVVSNMFYGQGPWTPFQMFVWGIIGYIAGIIFFKKEKINRALLICVGIMGGVVFSLLMDIWTTISFDGELLLSRYLAYIISSLPFMAIYAVSNVIFLLVLTKPILQKLERVKLKYGIFLSRSF